ncbi:SGNH/GDSL hydrolase family protein [Novosphingobium cyanobacteriorum]|uniref:SGNH/GDSL hydrolase family protein n=1 Tax=Novosphingobium cyanobacteriorum TaxID=3024215 RepID=A0ABT6CLG1_9SPHN|nr:SGNH/GDSL hydrolase family protein [Novosphingobium cyanobacteriorum]MDF8334354.1 SGNH/GDSL hydrolase family protein [Novosphingobium cyanobacteriorum]
MFGFRVFQLAVGAALLFLAEPFNSARAATEESAELQWIGSWAAAPSDELAMLPTVNPIPFFDQTLRTVITLSAGGEAVRVRISNELGTARLKIGAVTVGRWRDGAIVPGSIKTVLFRQHGDAVIPGGAGIDSDPLDLKTARGEKLAISIYVPGPVQRLTGHLLGLDQSWSIQGNATGTEQLPAALPGFARLLLSRVDVGSKMRHASTIVALGDSITDGYQSSFGAEKRWPDVLARLLKDRPGCTVGIVNQGISSNQMLTSGDGLSAVARVGRDVFAVPNARTLILLEGINDLGMPPLKGEPVASAADLKAAFQQIADEAHARGLRIVVATILPFKGAGAPYFSTEGERVRQEMNDWMRGSSVFDHVIDLDRRMADRKDADRLAADFDSGDGLHPSDNGYEAIGQEMFAYLDKDLCH